MRSTNPSREFIVIRDIYKEVKGKPKLVKRDVPSRMRIYIDEIFMVEELVSGTGREVKGRCGITTRDKGFIVIKEKFDSVSKEIFGDYDKEAKKVGFNV